MRINKFFFFIILVGLLSTTDLFPQNQLRLLASEPVTVKDDTLFFIHAPLGHLTAKKRAFEISEHINDLIKQKINADSFIIKANDIFVNLSYNNRIIFSLSPLDTIGTDLTQILLAEKYSTIIKKGVRKAQKEYSLNTMVINSLISFGIFALVVFLFWVIKKIFKTFYLYVGSNKHIKFNISIKGKEILNSEDIEKALILFLRLIRLGLTLLIIYYFFTIVLSLFPQTKEININHYIRGFLYTVFVTAIFISLIKLINSFFSIINQRIDEWKESILKTINIKNIQLFSEGRLIEITELSTKTTKYIFIVILTYLYFGFVFSFFPFSQNWADTLLSYFMVPILKVFYAFTGYIPNLVTIVVIVFFVKYILKLIHFIFNEVTTGRIVLEKFPAEWADPTFKIVKFLVIVFAAIVIFPYLPGSNSPIFQGFSVFIGILFSLGSSSAISNIVAGVVLTYMRPFKIGDRVKIAETTGDVIEKTLLVTRVKTTKNVEITIPNSMILGSHIVNFSSSVQGSGLILHSTVTIGYDVPFETVHKLLISAALDTPDLLKEPTPFVLQTGLEDFYVSYEINAYTLYPNKMARIYSELHANIQNKFNEAGVEIMSPHYSAMRDGNQTTIPEDYLPKTYNAPSFRITDIFGGKKE